MDPYAVSHFSNQALLQDLRALVARERATTAVPGNGRGSCGNRGPHAR